MLRLVAVVLVCFFANAEDYISPQIAGSHVDETRGYELRDFQLVPPYNTIDDWILHGDAFATRKWLRLTREERSLVGSVWSRSGLMARDWEIQAHLRISSDGIPADGMGIWYTEKTGSGTAWGAPAKFNGIGVVLDTYVNEGGESATQPLRLFILVNTPSQDAEVNVNVDGNNLKVLPECNFKANRIVTQYSADNPVPSLKVLIRYARETLQVFYSLPKENLDHWTLCTNASGLYLPVNYHVGVSAATGDLMSGHDLLSFKVFEIDTFRPVSDRPATEVQYYGGYMPARGPKASSFLSDLWSFMQMVIVLILVMGILYGLYKVTDRYVDESFITGRPRRRFY